MTEPTDPALAVEYLAAHGYHFGPSDVLPETIRLWDDGRYIFVKRLLFHWTLIEGHIDQPHGYLDRWCYETKDGAADAARNYPADWPEGYEPMGWHRHPATGRRREKGDPATEEIDP